MSDRLNPIPAPIRTLREPCLWPSRNQTTDYLENSSYFLPPLLDVRQEGTCGNSRSSERDSIRGTECSEGVAQYGWDLWDLCDLCDVTVSSGRCREARSKGASPPFAICYLLFSPRLAPHCVALGDGTAAGFSAMIGKRPSVFQGSPPPLRPSGGS
jgi:hypothetical protein